MQRRTLHLDSLDDAVAECRRLLAAGYSRGGRWSLGQVCRHLRLTIDPSIEGYPWWMSLSAPVRPVLRWALLPRLLRGDSPAGIKTAAVFAPPEEADDHREVEELAACVARFNQHTGRLHPHPGFGRFDHASLGRFHAAHAAHHLGFLAPNA